MKRNNEMFSLTCGCAEHCRF